MTNEPVDDHSHERALDVVVWRPSGEVLMPEALRALPLDLSDERGLTGFIATIEERTGMRVVPLRITNEIAHVELVGGPAAWSGSADWQPRAAAIGGKNAWEQLGWWARGEALADAELSSIGIRRTGPWTHRKHWSISALLSAETNAGAVWFKQVPPFMAHEGALTAYLAMLRPDALPDVLAFGADWCIMRGFPAPPADAPGSDPFVTLADLQAQTAGSVDVLLELGCPDRRFPRLTADLEDLCVRDDVLVDDERGRLADALPALVRFMAQLEESGPPDAVVHGDLHEGNCAATPDGWVLYDWTDGCVAHPFLDLGVVFPVKDVVARDARVAAYVGAWPGIPASEVPKMLLAARPLGLAHQAVSYQRIIDGLASGEGVEWSPAVASFLRQMHACFD